ncbi:MAG: hypothetical protein MRY57_01365 [Candidatus Pacebacteria bacterium]|nr:hypothetical protein [Candidatus Paceibacterota bacterium]
MELEKLIAQRDAYAGKMVPLMIKIAVIFLVPAIIGVAITKIWGINFLYLFPAAFILSWSGVIYLYRKYAKEVRALDARIKELRNQDTHQETSENTEGSDAN